jgi:two-component system, OmpR family, phosphate regulon sensor histidine kinase PhoR
MKKLEDITYRHELIERYLDADTSVEEEQALADFYRHCENKDLTDEDLDIRNLMLGMENSVKYSGDLVNIHVACRDTEKEEVMISVSDNGIGISPDEQQRVWTKFYRSNAYPDMMQPGIGLGLSFVDMIVKAHGGRKMMQSEVGKGTRISIVIPQHS